MLEKHNIQTRGFHNITDEEGNVTGFQFRLRTKYYKGLWLSQLRIGDVIVDGERYPRELQTWIINRTAYTPDEMLEIGDQLESTYWQVVDAAVVQVRKPGGLEQGYHEIEVKYGWTNNYFPPFMMDPVLGVQLSTSNTKRELLIV